VADRIYLPPGNEISQGDLYRDAPTVHIEARPLLVARPYRPRQEPNRPSSDRQTYGVHQENGQPPAGGFKWRMDQSGEDILAHSYLGMAMVISHDCEIENDPKHRTLAMVRLATDLQPQDRVRVFNFEVYSAFPLEPQDEEPRMEPAFVDFRRLTTVHPAVLASSIRFASVTEDLRKAMAERFWLYLHRPLEEEGSE
jgi:hypothetical protein